MLNEKKAISGLGPKKDKSGKIIPYSIVGKLEWLDKEMIQNQKFGGGGEGRA